MDHLKRFVPETNIFSLPYAFDGIDHQLKFLNGDFFKTNIQQPLKQRGIRLINPSWNWQRALERKIGPYQRSIDERGNSIQTGLAGS